MTRVEVRNKINQIIDGLPDSTLETVYEIFKKAELQKKNNVDTNLEKILKDDFSLLQRLAQ